ncbi:methyltransferase domain-containing protein [Mycobacterium yunnanensis]|uniref:Methyltransferase domain-containing protein n=1 Tax=Mycobacterium yunnanensis TaxID=368477 RepID=A0A9X2YXH0_9MYCO|nr:nodulation S family protein [Mycobacterium yunnanensis]MCV7419379.1 methyltransferase domain-containing protein [Mycobacterium yunnanensis]
MTDRLPDEYFDDVYADSSDPWGMAERWYERRKYSITMAMLPQQRYRHAFEPGCSIGMLTERLVERCDRVTSYDVAQAALDITRGRLGDRDGLELVRSSLDAAWPGGDVDLVVISEVAYYLSEAALRRVLDRECPRLAVGTTLLAAHWRHPVADYPLTGDRANAVIGETAGLTPVAHYLDDDVVIDVFRFGPSESVAVDTGVPGAVARG